MVTSEHHPLIYLGPSLPLAAHSIISTLGLPHLWGSSLGEADPPRLTENTTVLNVTFQNLDLIFFLS